jgi:hypothetical protein
MQVPVFSSGLNEQTWQPVQFTGAAKQVPPRHLEQLPKQRSGSSWHVPSMQMWQSVPGQGLVSLQAVVGHDSWQTPLQQEDPAGFPEHSSSESKHIGPLAVNAQIAQPAQSPSSQHSAQAPLQQTGPSTLPEHSSSESMQARPVSVEAQT